MIEIKNLRFDYKKNKPLFSEFALNLESGKIVGVLGKNGAGKTTLLKLVAGLLAPRQGELSVNGYKPFRKDPDFLSDIYMIPEEFSLPSISISGYVKALVPLYPAFDKEKMNAILDEFELSPSDNLNRLSHGQRKKFLIAFALATNCKILILDEPTNGLDIPSKSLFRKVLVGSVSDEQLVLISTHQVKDVDTVIDTIVVVENGTAVFQDDTESVGRKYLFETAPNEPDDATVIYKEKSLLGYRVIRSNDGNDETTIDLELLFNAIIHKKI
jgi:ABC-2 type transport system ATP-binding protein